MCLSIPSNSMYFVYFWVLMLLFVCWFSSAWIYDLSLCRYIYICFGWLFEGAYKFFPFQFLDCLKPFWFSIIFYLDWGYQLDQWYVFSDLCFWFYALNSTLMVWVEIWFRVYLNLFLGFGSNANHFHLLMMIFGWIYSV